MNLWNLDWSTKSLKSWLVHKLQYTPYNSKILIGYSIGLGIINEGEGEGGENLKSGGNRGSKSGNCTFEMYEVTEFSKTVNMVGAYELPI